MTRRTIRAVSAFLATGLIAATLGLLSADYHGSLGPNEADYTVRLNNEIRVDMGPLGALILDSPLPLHLGVDVQVGEIPIGLATPDSDPMDGLRKDLQTYVQFFSNATPAIGQAADGLISNALRRFALFWTLMLVAVACGRLASHGQLRTAVKEALHKPGVTPLSMAIVLALVVVPTIELTRTSGDVGRTSQVLDGTPLAGARITGRLATLVDFYGEKVKSALDANNSFYADANAHLLSVLEADHITGGEDGGAGPDAAGPGPSPSATQAGEAREGEAVDSGASGQAPGATASADASTDENPYIVGVMVSDLHCNVGMAQIIGTVVSYTHPDLILNGGDTAMAGTAVESLCIRSFNDGFGKMGVPVVFANGNHDSKITYGQETDAGWIPLDGKVIEVAGLRILGDTDPTLSSLGQPTHQVRDETIYDMGERLAKVGCEAKEAGEEPDVLLIHNPAASWQILGDDCAPVALAGHLHRQVGPKQLGYGTQFVSSTSGGAGQGSPTIGPLHNPAKITVIRWDKETKLPHDFRVVTIETDASAKLTPWQPWPAQPQSFVSGNGDEPGVQESPSASEDSGAAAGKKPSEEGGKTSSDSAPGGSSKNADKSAK